MNEWDVAKVFRSLSYCYNMWDVAKFDDYPLENYCKILLWKITIFIGKSTISVQFSIAMLNYQWVVIIDHTIYLRWMNTQLYPAFSSYYFWGELQEISWKKMTQFATLLRRLFELFVH